MKGKILCTAMLLTSLMTFPAFAKDIHAEIENANKENIEEVMSYSWNEINGQKQFIDQTGKAITGKFYDENGEIYDTGSSGNPYIIQNGYNNKKEYFVVS